MADGFYCNVNLIDMFANIEIIAMRLSSIIAHPEHHTIMIVDLGCATASAASGERVLNAVRYCQN